MLDFDRYIRDTQQERDLRMQAVAGFVKAAMERTTPMDVEDMSALMLKTSLAVVREEIRILYMHLAEEMNSRS